MKIRWIILDAGAKEVIEIVFYTNIYIHIMHENDLSKRRQNN
jgi:hypothetical protein